VLLPLAIPPVRPMSFTATSLAEARRLDKPIAAHYLPRVMRTLSKRSQRVGQLLQQELANMLVNEVRDPRIGFATITEVRVTPDLRSARVFVSIYGSEQERQQSLDGIAAASGFLQREVGRRLRLKYTPELSFSHDDSLDRADRLEQLIGAIADGKIETPGESQTQLIPVDTQRSGLAEKSKSFQAQPRPKQDQKPSLKKRSRRRKPKQP